MIKDVLHHMEVMNLGCAFFEPYYLILVTMVTPLGFQTVGVSSYLLRFLLVNAVVKGKPLN